MKTQNEIVAKINNMGDMDDMFSFAKMALIELLDFDHAEQFLKEDHDINIEEWNNSTMTARGTMKDYMPFAIDKACSHRGLSAGRSICKFTAWLWADDNMELSEFANGDANYGMYGAPILTAICEHYGWTEMLPTDAGWESMSEGEPCEPDCWDGCCS